MADLSLTTMGKDLDISRMDEFLDEMSNEGPEPQQGNITPTKGRNVMPTCIFSL